MCRWMAYSGSPIPVSELLLKPKHSLIDQSLHSTMGATTTNGDGFGLGWYGVGDTPGVFHSTEPAWNDRNLADLAAHLISPLVFAHVRASTGGAIQQTNCHPFRYENWLWMHNGLIREFATVKRDLAFAVDPSLYPDDRGLDRLRDVLLPGPDHGPAGRPVGRRRAGGRVHRGHRARPWGGRPDPDDGRHHGRHQHLGLPLLQRGRVPLAVPQHEHRDAARDVPGQPRAARGRPTRPG